jgi:hypothetical protein
MRRAGRNGVTVRYRATDSVDPTQDAPRLEGRPHMSAQATSLLAGLLFGHFLGDFTPLSTARMQAAKAAGGPLGPILAHAAVHGLLVALVVTTLIRPAPAAVAGLAAFELATHFLLDAGRAKLAARFAALADPARRPFWTLLGLDQLAHGLVLVTIVAWVT